MLDKVISLIDYIIPGTNNIKQELLKMRPQIKDLRDQLVDYNSNEIDIFSVVQSSRTMSKRYDKMVKAHFNSIYHEPLIAYIYKEFKFSKYAGIYASTKSNEYFYIIGPERTTIYVDTHLLGYFTTDGLLYAKKRGHLEARVNHFGSSIMPVIIRDREVASLVNPIKTEKYNPRMFEYLDIKQKSEELALIALSILVLVNMTRGIKKLRF